MTHEIQLHEASIVSNESIYVEYSIVDDEGIADVKQEIELAGPLELASEDNVYGPGYEMDFLADWLRKYVALHLERRLAA